MEMPLRLGLLVLAATIVSVIVGALVGACTSMSAGGESDVTTSTVETPSTTEATTTTATTTTVPGTTVPGSPKVAIDSTPTTIPAAEAERYAALLERPIPFPSGPTVPRVALWKTDRTEVPAWRVKDPYGEWIISADGDHIHTAPDGTKSESYNSRTGWVDGRFAPRDTPPPGGPDLRFSYPRQLDSPTRSRTAQAIEDGNYRMVTVNGREAYRIVDDGPFYRDGCDVYIGDTCHMRSRITSTIDAESGIVVESNVEYTPPLPAEAPESQTYVREVSPIEGGVSDADFEPGPDTVSGGPDGFVLFPDAGYAGGFAGYSILLPAWMPEGYELTHVAYAESIDERPYDGEDVVILVYRKGGWQIDITYRTVERVADWYRDGFWRDPYEPEFYREQGEIDVFGEHELPIAEYRYRIGGLVNHAWGLSPEWAADTRQLLTVGGAVGPEAMERILESLVPYYELDE